MNISTVWLCLQVARIPRSQDLAIFVLTKRKTDRRTEPIYCLLSMHMWGKRNSSGITKHYTLHHAQES